MLTLACPYYIFMEFNMKSLWTQNVEDVKSNKCDQSKKNKIIMLPLHLNKTCLRQRIMLIKQLPMHLFLFKKRMHISLKREILLFLTHLICGFKHNQRKYSQY